MLHKDMTAQHDFKNLCETHNFPIPTDAQLFQLTQYADLLQKWNKSINLIGKSTVSDIWARHIVDSYQLIPLILAEIQRQNLNVNGHLLDIGSGGGMPAVIIAIMCPTLHVSACEINSKKAAFLQTVRRDLSLSNFTVLHEDVQRIENPEFHLITARAFATISDIFMLTQLGSTKAFLIKNGAYILPKGESYQQEWDEMQQNFPTLNMTKNITSSITDRRGKILTIQPN